MSDCTTLSLEALARSARADFAVPFAAISFFPEASNDLESLDFGDLVHVNWKCAPCSATLTSGDVIIAQNMHQSEVFASNPFIREAPFIKSFMGAVVRGVAGNVIGTLCVFDSAIRTFDAQDVEDIRGYARRVADAIHPLDSSRSLNRPRQSNPLVGAVNSIAAIGCGEVDRYMVSPVYSPS